MAAAMLAAGVAALAVGVVVMITADIGIVCKRACQQGVHRRVRLAADAAVELDADLGQSIRQLRPQCGCSSPPQMR